MTDTPEPIFSKTGEELKRDYVQILELANGALKARVAQLESDRAHLLAGADRLKNALIQFQLQHPEIKAFSSASAANAMAELCQKMENRIKLEKPFYPEPDTADWWATVQSEDKS